MISLQDVQAAQSRIAPYITRTPLLRVSALDEALGCEVYLKFEGFQVRRNWTGVSCAPPLAITPRGWPVPHTV